MTDTPVQDLENGPDQGDDLIRLGLVTEGSGARGEDDPGGVEIAGLWVSPPLLYPILPEELTPVLRRRAASMSVRYVGMVCSATLDALPRGRAYTAVSLTVRLDGHCRAVGLEADTEIVTLFDGPDATAPVPMPSGFTIMTATRPHRYGALGRPWAAETRTGQPAQPVEGRSHGIYSPEFCWAYDASGADRLTGSSFATHAVVEVPADATELSGRLWARTRVQRFFAKFVHSQTAVTREGLTFREPVHHDPTGGTGRAVRLFVAADVADYSRRQIDAAERTQDRLVHVLERARKATGYEVDDRQVGGDSLVYAFPPGIDEGRAISRFYAELKLALDEVNADLDPRARLRLRVGVDRGRASRGAAGWAGQAVIGACRLLNSDQAKAALRRPTDPTLVLAVSHEVYKDVIRELTGPPGAETFQQVQATVAGKEFDEVGWIHAV